MKQKQKRFYPPVDIPPPNPHPGYDGGLIHTKCVTHVLGSKCQPCPQSLRPPPVDRFDLTTTTRIRWRRRLLVRDSLAPG